MPVRHPWLACRKRLCVLRALWTRANAATGSPVGNASMATRSGIWCGREDSAR